MNEENPIDEYDKIVEERMLLALEDDKAFDKERGILIRPIKWTKSKLGDVWSWVTK